MKEKHKFRFAEKCLYDYKKNLARLNVLCEDLRVLQCSSEVKVQVYDRIFAPNNSPSDGYGKSGYLSSLSYYYSISQGYSGSCLILIVKTLNVVKDVISTGGESGGITCFVNPKYDQKSHDCAGGGGTGFCYIACEEMI